MERLSARLILLVFCPFAVGYFLSFFFRNINAVIAPRPGGRVLASRRRPRLLDRGLPAGLRGFQLPLGVLLDRYGPRHVVGALLCIAAAGALVFGMARDFTMLWIGRALIGLGVGGAFAGGIKAFTL